MEERSQSAAPERLALRPRPQGGAQGEPGVSPCYLVRLRGGADRVELRLEERLVDLALVDRDPLLETEADHFQPLDPELLGQLLRRQVVWHLAACSFRASKSPLALLRLRASRV